MKILIVDDEPGAMKYFIRGLTRADYQIIQLNSAQKCWDYFGAPDQDLCAVILDIMMPPAKEFKDENHNSGLKSGLFLYRRILEQMSAGVLNGRHIPVAALTNANNGDVIKGLEKTRIRHGVSEPFKVWSKADTSVNSFVREFRSWLEAIWELNPAMKPQPNE